MVAMLLGTVVVGVTSRVPLVKVASTVMVVAGVAGEGDTIEKVRAPKRFVGIVFA
jgi:hypothetical protein